MKKIKLSTGKTVEMRKPKVRDMMMAKEIENDMDREIAILGNLTEMSEEELYDLDLADYKVIQKAFTGFQTSKQKT